jgi:peptidoglycan/LPS O-acetylase OafA/YrhL
MSEGSVEIAHAKDRSGRRLLPLDGLRGVAALAVVLFHFLSNGPRAYPELGERVAWAHAGQQGVRVFFVISGIVILMSLRNSTPAAFVRSRFIRLFPSYWIAIIITATVVTIFHLPGEMVSVRDVILNFSMVQGLAGIHHVDGAYWTLTVELVFYVISATLWFNGFLSDRKLPTTLYVWLAASLGGALLARHFNLEGFSGVFENLPWFLVGIVALRLHEGDRRVALVAFVPIALLSGVYFDWASVLGAAAGFVLVLTILAWRSLGLASAPLRALGWASYPLYLLHQNIGYVILLRLDDVGLNRWLAVLITVVFSVCVAFAFTKWIDVPLRGRIRKLLA